MNMERVCHSERGESGSLCIWRECVTVNVERVGHCEYGESGSQ